MKNPYFSFDGMYFKTPGDELETQMNILIATEILQKFVLGGDQKDAMEALGYLEDQFPKLERLCDEMRIMFLMDDFDDTKNRYARNVYNRIIDKINS